MNAVKDLLERLVFQILTSVYGGVIFDTAGLARLLFPCLLFVILGVLIYLVLKLFVDLRRVAHVTVTAVLIALIALSSFLPSTMLAVGDLAAGWLQERVGITEELPPEIQDGGINAL